MLYCFVFFTTRTNPEIPSVHTSFIPNPIMSTDVYGKVGRKIAARLLVTRPAAVRYIYRPVPCKGEQSRSCFFFLFSTIQSYTGQTTYNLGLFDTPMLLL